MSNPIYWNRVAEDSPSNASFPIWRQYCDRLHEAMLQDWLGSLRFTNSLKTDLFDEHCGRGLVSELQKYSDAVMGLEISEVIARSVNGKFPDFYPVVGDVRRVPLSSDSVDFIFSNSTLDHFETLAEIDTAIAELVRVTRPGRFLLVSLDNPSNPVVRLRNMLPTRLFGTSSVLPYAVGRTLSLQSLSEKLEASGCDVLRSGHIMHIPRVLMLHLTRLVRPGSVIGRRLLSAMMKLEFLSRWPTAKYTGHFSVVLARKRPQQ